MIPTVINKTVLFFLDFFYPEFCILCDKNLDTSREIAICADCRIKNIIRKKPEFICYKCGREILVDLKIPAELIICRDCLNAKLYYEQCRHIFHYSDAIQKIIKRYKYDCKRDFADLLTDEIIFYIKNPENEYSEIAFDLITNIPGHKNKIKKKEFDHINILCEKLSARLNINYLSNILIKYKDTPNQAGLARKERIKNVKNSFQLNSAFDLSQFENKNILLIDDVFSTGSTINECSKPLKKGCPTVKIYGLTIARG